MSCERRMSVWWMESRCRAMNIPFGQTKNKEEKKKKRAEKRRAES